MLRDKCPGSQAFPTSYNGENTRCTNCHRLLRLHVNGKVPNHNAPARRRLMPYEPEPKK